MRIWKYTLLEAEALHPARIARLEGWRVAVEIPAGARLLQVANQAGAVVVWAQVDETAPRVRRAFALVETGKGMDPRTARDGTYLGTVQQGAAYVVHVFALPITPGGAE